MLRRLVSKSARRIHTVSLEPVNTLGKVCINVDAFFFELLLRWSSRVDFWLVTTEILIPGLGFAATGSFDLLALDPEISSALSGFLLCQR